MADVVVESVGPINNQSGSLKVDRGVKGEGEREGVEIADQVLERLWCRANETVTGHLA